MEVQDSGMKRVLRLRDGDSERGSGIQQGTRTGLGGAQMRREIVMILPLTPSLVTYPLPLYLLFSPIPPLLPLFSFVPLPSPVMAVVLS